MSNKKILAFMSVILFFLNHSIAITQDQLTKTEIEQYLSSISGLQSLDAEIDAESKNDDEATENQILFEPDSMSLTPISDSIEQITLHPTFEKFTAIINKAGFSSPQEWASTGDRIMIAYGAYQLKNPPQNKAATLDEIKNEMQTSLERIEKNQFISNEQKQTLINKIQKSMALMSDPNYIDNENIPIISPYLVRLNSLFKDYQ